MVPKQQLAVVQAAMLITPFYSSSTLIETLVCLSVSVERTVGKGTIVKALIRKEKGQHPSPA